jgi:hypothetical protein
MVGAWSWWRASPRTAAALRGVISSRVKDRPTCRLKDLPHGSVPLRLWVCKRRFLDGEALRICEVLAVVVLDASVHVRLVHSADSRRPSWQVALTGHPTLTNASNATSWTPSTESIGAVQGSPNEDPVSARPS